VRCRIFQVRNPCEQQGFAVLKQMPDMNGMEIIMVIYSYLKVMTGLSSGRTHGAIFVSSPKILSWGKLVVHQKTSLTSKNTLNISVYLSSVFKIMFTSDPFVVLYKGKH
jgi:hypothetical protein